MNKRKIIIIMVCTLFLIIMGNVKSYGAVYKDANIEMGKIFAGENNLQISYNAQDQFIQILKDEFGYSSDKLTNEIKLSTTITIVESKVLPYFDTSQIQEGQAYDVTQDPMTMKSQYTIRIRKKE